MRRKGEKMNEREQNRSTSLTPREQNEEGSGLTSREHNEERRRFYAPTKHNRLQRKVGYDYSRPGMYLITVTTTDRLRLLGTLIGESLEEARVEASPLGESVVRAFREMAAKVTKESGCRVQVLQYQIMPDHFHGILYIRDVLSAEWTLGRMIAGWKGECSRMYWRYLDLMAEERNEEKDASLTPRKRDEEKDSSLTPREQNEKRKPLFTPGFNDRILFHKGQLKAWIEYLRDNPSRLWLKMNYPDRLHKVRDFVAGRSNHRYTAMGEILLARYPDRMQVRCHRKLSEEEIHAEEARYLAIARSGVVLVSPFISPAEKAVYAACYKEKLRMIHIVKRGLDGKFVYPSGADLRGCTFGFLLVLAPYEDYSPETSEERITRAQCLDMNAYAKDLSTLDISSLSSSDVSLR